MTHPEESHLETPSQTTPGPIVASSHGSGGHGPGKTKRTNKRGTVAAVIVVAVLLLIGIIPRLRQNSKLAAIHRQLSDTPPPVDVVSPYASPKNTDLTLPSSIQAIQDTTIYARTTGYLHELLVDIGSHVKAGQLLATIESPEVEQQLAESQADVAKQEATDRQSAADVYRLQAGVSSAQAQVAESRSNLEGAIGDVAHMKAKLTESRGAESAAKARLSAADHKLEESKASLGQFMARESLADKTYKRWKELARGGAVSGQDLDEAQAGYETSSAAVNAAQAAVEAAKADVVSASADVQSRTGDVSAALADIDSAKDRVVSARSALDSTKANVNAASAAVSAGRATVQASDASVQSSKSAEARVNVFRSFEKVVAPFSGVITARNVDVGSLIGAGSGTGEGFNDPQSTVPHSGMFGIARTDFLRIQVNVPQDFIGDIHKGDPAEVTTSQFPEVTFYGKVFDTAGALDVSTRTLLVEVRLANVHEELIPGMYAEVHFQLHDSRPSLRLAADALIIDSSGTRVAVVAPNLKIHFATIKLGRDFGKEVEVLSGLRVGDRVVENPSDDLTEGESVTVTPAQKS